MNVEKYAAPKGALFLVWMRLHICRAYDANNDVMGISLPRLKIALPLAIVSVCLLGYVLNFQSGIFHELQAALLSLQWMLLACLTIWCATFLFLTFRLNVLPLVGLLVIAIVAYFIGTPDHPTTDALILLAGVTMGRGARFALAADCRWQMADGENNLESGKRKAESENLSTLTPSLSHPTGEGENKSAHVACHSSLITFLFGLVGLLAFASWWHLDMAGAYHGPRWMGLWDNPNIYGILMGAGVVLATGLLLGDSRWKLEDGKSEIADGNWKMADGENKNRKAESGRLEVGSWKLAIIFLFVAAGMMAVGLVMSYSRGAWLATAIGLLYLAWSYGKLKWRFVLPGCIAVVVVICIFWHSTADNAPWYLKRLDLSRPSAQHRVSAWRGAVQMMRDHPLGVGWNRAVSTYEKDYSPPEGGAAALTMNSYLMLGTELGLPGLICFVWYVALCFKGNRPYLTLTLSPPAAGSGEGINSPLATRHSPLCVACRAGAITLLVAFWFDGGLFTLATAAVFWVLLELGKDLEDRNGTAES